jgi:mRNA interferase YafQ
MKYAVDYTSRFKKQYKRLKKQGKDIKKLRNLITILANGEVLPPEYRNHKLFNDRYYQNCFECHIEPDWLLVYKIENNTLVLLLHSTGSHSELFD